MSKTKLDGKFFETTRGQIVMHLRNGSRSVNDLASDLGLTDNAIRANLMTLERDHLVESAGTVKTVRRPYVVYRLTDEARHLFPKSYDSLFNRLLEAVKHRFSPASITGLMHEVGKKIGSGAEVSADADIDEKIAKTLIALEELGGAAVVERDARKVWIKSQSCPFADAVAEHPEVCRMAEAMVEEIVGLPVEEYCDRTHQPKCCFAIDTARL
jgi:predicted ArsR family transcriptional regulator